MEAWDIAAGMEMRLFTLPKLTVILNSFVTYSAKITRIQR